jgi:hypothetical protein
MKSAPRSANRGGAVIAPVVSAAFLWALLLSVSPQLHQQIHADANRVEHACAVTFVTSGSYVHCAHPPLIGAPARVSECSKIPALASPWIESAFLLGSIFEHAPPANS